MGLLLNSLITACSLTSHTPSDLQACEKATQAGMQQSGIQQTVDSFEERQVHYWDGRAKEWFGQSGYYAVGGAYLLVRTAVTKSVGIRLNQYWSFEAGPPQTLIKFEIRF